MPTRRDAISAEFVFKSCCLANANIRWVSAEPRSAPCIAPSSRRCARGSSGNRLRRSSRLPITAVRRLLKSWATPPVSWPTASIFWLCRRASSAWFRSAVSASSASNALCSSAVRWVTLCSSVLLIPSSASCARFCSSMSVAEPNHSMIRPATSRTGSPRMRNQRNAPSWHRMRCSSWKLSPASMAFWKILLDASRSSGWIASSQPSA
jgi:hypothetical protein